MNYIVEAWLSPWRREVYSHNIMEVGTVETPVNWDYPIEDHFIHDEIFDLFEEDKGLWKVICAVSVSYRQCQSSGEWDTEIAVGDITLKTKCYNFSDFKSNYIRLGLCKYKDAESRYNETGTTGFRTYKEPPDGIPF